MTAEKVTVFIVDDEKSMRDSLGRLVRSAGYGVEAFDGAEAFLGRTPIEDIGCLVLDVSMPGTSGPELHDELLSRGTFLPTIFLTGHGDVPTSVREMKKGAVDFLLKPVDDDALLKVIDSAVERCEATRDRGLERQRITACLRTLTPREHEVLECVLDGCLNKQTAATLGIVEKTVKVHRGRVMEKMHVRSVAELVHRCELAGLRPGRQG